MSKPINVVDVARHGVERDDRMAFNVAIKQDEDTGQCLVRVRMSRQGDDLLTMYFQADNVAEAEQFTEQTRPFFRSLVAVHVAGEDGSERCI